MKLYSSSENFKNDKTPLGNTGSNRQTVSQPVTKSLPVSGVPVGGDVPPPTASPLGEVAPTKIHRPLFGSGRLCPRLHWLQGTAVFYEESLFVDLVNQLLELFGDTGIFTGGAVGGRGKKYQKSGYSTKNLFYSWNPPQTLQTGEIQPGDGWISISGAVLDSVSLPVLKSCCLLLCAYDFKATRADFAIDDYSCPPVDQFIEQAKAGNFAGFRYRVSGSGAKQKEPSYSIYSSPYTQDDVTALTNTLNFGGRGSDKKFVVYNKTAESKGETEATRFEARYADEQSHIRFQALCKVYLNNSLEAAQKLIGSFCLGAIDFIDRSEDERRDRCSRFAWWQELIDCLDSITLPVPRPIPSLERTLDWCARQWACTAAILEKVAGFNDSLDYFTRLFENGKKRLKAPHLSIIKQAVNEGFNINSYLQSSA